jgi:hypothetical protein
MFRTLFKPGIDLPPQQVEANRRYWESEESVNGIAEAMGISKGGLYELLLPFDAEVACPECGAPLGYAHRTARQRGDLSCAACGFEGKLGELPEPSDEALAAATRRRTGGAPARGAPGGGHGEDGEEQADTHGGRSAPRLWSDGAGEAGAVDRNVVAGAVLLGAAVGLVLARLLRR